MVYELVEVDRLKTGDDNVRHDVGDVNELAASMKAGGVLQPLLVDEADLVVVAGSRRLAAARMAGLTVVPVMKRAFTPQERLETMLVENLQREDLTPLEEAEALQRLADLGLTQRQIAARVGRSQGHVAKRLSLLALPQAVQQQVAKGTVTLPDAQELAKLKDAPDVVAKIAQGGTKAYGQSISSQVEQEVTKREREKKRKELTDALVAKGEPIVEIATDEYGYRVNLPDGVREVRKEAYTAEFVEMDPKKHAKLECHGVFVHPRSMETVEVCTKPDSHPSKADQIKAQRQKEAAARRKEEKAFEEMNERRRSFVRDQIAARVDKDGLLELAYLALTRPHRWAYYDVGVEYRLACGLAKLEVPEEVANLEQVEWDLVLAVEAEKSATARMRVTMAIAAAQFEVMLGNGREGAWANEAPWFEWLKKRGYEMSETEKKLVEGDKDAPR